MATFFAAFGIILGIAGIVWSVFSVIDSQGKMPVSKKRIKLTMGVSILTLGIVVVISSLFSFFPSGSSPGNYSTKTPTQRNEAQQTINTPDITPTPTASQALSPTPISPKPGDILYQANWSQGMNGWAGGSDWNTVASMLVNSGQQKLYDLSMGIAPYNPGDEHVKNYAIEARIQLNQYTDGNNNQDVAYGRDMFGLIFHSPDGQNQGYLFAICSSNTGAWNCGNGPHEILLAALDGNGGYKIIEEKPYSSPKYGESHTYRVEIKDNTITAFVDNVRVFEKVDYTYTSAGEIGVWSTRSQISVSSFKVSAA